MDYRFRKELRDDDDIHEILKKEIQPRVLNPIVGNESEKIIEHYVVLDSFIKLETSKTEVGEFKWLFNSQGLSTSETIGVKEVIDYVTEIQFGTFFIPTLEDVTYFDLTFLENTDVNLIQNNSSPGINEPPTLVRNGTVSGQYPTTILRNDAETYVFPWINNPYTQVPYYNRMTIQIVEAGLQSYVNMNNTRFNFEYELRHDTDMCSTSNYILARAVDGDNWDSFVFSTPLRDLLSMTVIFRNPDDPISFEPDVMYRSVLNITFDIFSLDGYHITITTQYDHKLRAGDRIFLKNFVPKDPVTGIENPLFPQHIKNYINRSQGHAINTVPGTTFFPLDPGEDISGSAFSLDPSLKILLPIDANILACIPGLVDVYIAKRRLRIPVRIKCSK